MPSEPEHVNPFAAPVAVDDPVASSLGGDLTEAEAIRKELLSREASIKSIGLLYVIGGGLWLLGGLSVVGVSLAGEIPAEDGVDGRVTIGLMGVIGVLGGLSLYCGLGLRRLDPAIRPWVIGVQSLSMLANLPQFNVVGLLIGLYVLVQVTGEKGKRVLSKEYQDIIAATPHIKYKTSIVVWILLGVLVALLLFAFAAIALA